jgi:hypothetical protein
MILVWKKQFQDIRISAQVKAVWFSLIPKLPAPADSLDNLIISVRLPPSGSAP